ncbi:MAG: hypothetical protein EZS28_009457 [Streblomastix strix]|uniref:Reverse transcriptase domain-containing protein n=1 Tax=Streblomastix strix TaxID=222440 RepID=A0A5J4WJD5_9EUKA|nr:MAG: hypothetical protein EZS28_009457 [Streblomastix strix]
MSFEVSLAPRIFAKAMKAMMQEIRIRWLMKAVQYTDNILLLWTNKLELEKKTQEIIIQLYSMGWTIQEKKCRLMGEQIFTFLGWEINSIKEEIKITKDKQKNLKALIQATLRRIRMGDIISIKEIASILGMLNFLRTTIQEASFYNPQMNRIIRNHVVNNYWDVTLIAPKQIITEIELRHKMININIPLNISHFNPTVTPTTDASIDSWSRTLDTQTSPRYWKFGPFAPKEKIRSSNFRETTAVPLSLIKIQPILNELQIKDFLVQTDNQITAHNIN